MKKIFSFTLMQQLRSKGYRMGIAIGMVLCVALPVLIMVLAEAIGGNDDAAGEEVTELAVKTVYSVDLSEPALESLDFLEDYGEAPYDALDFISCGNLEEAKELSQGDDTSVIAVMGETSEGYQVNVLLPENTTLTEEDAQAVAAFFEQWSSAILLQKSGLHYTQLTELMTPVDLTVYSGQEIPEAEEESVSIELQGQEAMVDASLVKEILQYVFCFLNIMLLYFLVLFYGQSVANSMVMEKTSKLMETFLISVRPEQMAFGKVLALTLCSLIQLGAWLLALAAGVAAGVGLVHLMNPESEQMILQVMDVIGQVSGLFYGPGILMAILIIVGGMLLYNSLAAIGGAIAGKMEDISSSNVMFTLILVISFFAVLYSGGIDSMGTGGAEWQNYVPFTAVLVAPARLLLGQMSVVTGAISLALILLLSGVIMYIAGRAYKMMALYRGEFPGPIKVLGRLFR